MAKYVLNYFIIDRYMKKHNLSKKEFSKNCGISLYILNKVMSGSVDVPVLSVYKIAKYINVEIVKLFILVEK